MAEHARHIRQQLLPDIGESGQARLKQARVLLIGAGGLGCPAALYLAASGIGHLTVCDHDRVDATNLARQVLYRERDIGRSKVTAMTEYLRGLDPAIQLEAIEQRMDAASLQKRLRDADVVVDGSDNFATRLAVNRACIAVGTPWVMGAAVRFEGQLAVFRPDLDPSPCYQCLYSDAAHTLDDCQGSGVFTPLTGLIGAAMAGEAIRVLLQLHDPPTRLSLYDARRFEWTQPRVRANPECSACR